MSRRASAAILAVLGLLTLLLVRPAVAQVPPGCEPPRPIADMVATAPTAFVGTVADARDENREVTVLVIRVWRGGPMPSQVDVRGTIATQSKVHTALDRTYAKGATYLFLPTAGASPKFIENECSSTAILTRELAALAPAGGGQLPTGSAQSPRSGVDIGKMLPLAIGVGGFSCLLAWFLTTRRRHGVPRPTRDH